jgi:hypothetical protein
LVSNFQFDPAIEVDPYLLILSDAPSSVNIEIYFTRSHNRRLAYPRLCIHEQTTLCGFLSLLTAQRLAADTTAAAHKNTVACCKSSTHTASRCVPVWVALSLYLRYFPSFLKTVAILFLSLLVWWHDVFGISAFQAMGALVQISYPLQKQCV